VGPFEAIGARRRLGLIHPGSIAPFAALAVLQVYGAVDLSPYISNHWLFTTFVNTAILLSAALLIARRSPPRMSRVNLFAAFAPATRLAVIVLYAFAVFHKLNRDFLDPAVSCGTTFYAEQLGWPFLPQSPAIELASIYAALGFEAAIPLLLCWPRTRVAGIIVGAVFHWVLALNPTDRFYNFSSMLLALFSLVAPAYAVMRIDPDHARFRFLTGSVLVGFLVALFVKRWAAPAAIAGTDPVFVLWNIYAVAITVGFIVLAWRGRHEHEREHARPFAIRPPILVVLPLVVFLNGLAPYVGLKTDTAWAMFSNLRTEGGRTNHLLMPTRAQAFDFQRDLVQVTGSSDKYLQSLARTRQLVPYFEIRRRPGVSVSYVRDGVERRFAQVSDDPAFSSTIPRVVRRLMLFRPVDRGEKQTCLH
jgi:hypothetical protein